MELLSTERPVRWKMALSCYWIAARSAKPWLRSQPCVFGDMADDEVQKPRFSSLC